VSARNRAKQSFGHQARYQQPTQIAGSTTGATPNATDSMANTISMIEVHTPKTMSKDFRRSCFVATGGYKTVGENKITPVSNTISRPACVAEKGSKVQSTHNPGQLTFGNASEKLPLWPFSEPQPSGQPAAGSSGKLPSLASPQGGSHGGQVGMGYGQPRIAASASAGRARLPATEPTSCAVAEVQCSISDVSVVVPPKYCLSLSP
jgi:hypothetical protein